MTDYRFPIPSAERVLLLVSGITATAMLPMIWRVVSVAVDSTGMSLWEFMSYYGEVRVPIAGVLVVWLLSVWAGCSWWLQKSGTLLTCGPEQIRFSRPSFGGLPGTARSLEGRPAEILFLHVGRRMRGAQIAWCVEFRLQGRVVLLNLEHAIATDHPRPVRPRDGAGAMSHPLVAELSGCTSQVPRLL